MPGTHAGFHCTVGYLRHPIRKPARRGFGICPRMDRGALGRLEYWLILLVLGLLHLAIQSLAYAVFHWVSGEIRGTEWMDESDLDDPALYEPTGQRDRGE